MAGERAAPAAVSCPLNEKGPEDSLTVGDLRAFLYFELRNLDYFILMEFRITEMELKAMAPSAMTG